MATVQKGFTDLPVSKPRRSPTAAPRLSTPVLRRSKIDLEDRVQGLTLTVPPRGSAIVTSPFRLHSDPPCAPTPGTDPNLMRVDQLVGRKSVFGDISYCTTIGFRCMASIVLRSFGLLSGRRSRGISLRLSSAFCRLVRSPLRHRQGVCAVVSAALFIFGTIKLSDHVLRHECRERRIVSSQQ